MTHHDDDKQRIAAYLAARRGRSLHIEDPELYDTVRAEILRRHPTHSLHRGALAHEAYGAALRARGHSVRPKLDAELKNIGMTPTEYLRQAKANARMHQYNPDVLTFADNGKSKLKYDSPEGPRYFGRVGYRDYIMWHHLAKTGKMKAAVAEGKKRAFRESHEEISERYQLGKHSPNELALKILWA